MRANLSDVTKRLQTGSRFVDAHPKWVSVQNLHMTLVFLGNTDPRRVPEIGAIMRETAANAVPFELALNGLSYFPPGKEARVLTARVDGDLGHLKNLYHSLARGLSKAGFAVQDRPFRPHLTIARVPSVKTASRLARIVESHSGMLQAKFPVEEFVLFQSQLNSGGSIYTPLETVTLR